MAQLYVQRNAQPDTWVMSGAPTATTVFLSLVATINYSDGSSDTLPANTLAVLPDTTTVFDRTHDVYVCYTVQTSGVLSVIKESLLPTLTSAYAPLCRIELHGIKPYQPEPYLAAGGVGGGPPLETVVVSDTSARVLDLGTGGSAPAGWQTPSFDDSAWAAAQVEPSPPIGAALGASSWVGTAPGTVAGTDRWLLRKRFVLPAGALSAASLQFWADNYIDSLWLNGTDITSASGVPSGGWFGGGGAVPVTTSVAPGVLLPGAANVLAVQVRNATAAGYNPTSLDFVLHVTGPGTGGVPDPGGHEGDLLYSHSGAWVTLPVGTTGQELTVVAGDPAWATPAAGYTDPLTTKGDLLTRSSSATVRLGVGTNGQVVTADSTAADGITWATPAASGVTSIDVAAPAPLSSSGGPITSSGTITLSWTSGQTANRVLASPDGTTGSVSLRALVAGDIPSLPASQITSGRLALARGGTAVDASAVTDGQLLIGQSSDHTLGLATLSAGSGVTISNAGHSITINAVGGSGGVGTVTSVALSLPGLFSVSGSPITTAGTLGVSLATQSANTVLAGPASGSAAAPAFRALQGSDLPAAAAAGGHIHAHGHFL